MATALKRKSEMAKFYSTNIFTGNYICQCGREFPDKKSLFRHIDECRTVSPMFKFNGKIKEVDMPNEQVRVIDEDSEFYGKRGTLYEKTEFLGQEIWHVFFLGGEKAEFKPEALKAIHDK